MKYDVAIIGGSGFVGSSVARYISDSSKLKILDLNPIPESIKDRVTYQRCDIRNYQEVISKLRNVELVVHTAIVQIPQINEEKRTGYEVNIRGTENICKAVERSPLTKGLLLSGSWHVFGEKGFRGVISEEFGFQPDKVEDRARLYVLSKIAQEVIVKYFGEISEKTYGIIRSATVLGENMPEGTAANIFISRGLKGLTITPYEHSMWRPMLYIDINDLCKAFYLFAKKILDNEMSNGGQNLNHVVNVTWPEPITILELANIVREQIIDVSGGKIKPSVETKNLGEPNKYSPEDKKSMPIDISKMRKFLGIEELTSPKQAIRRIIEARIAKYQKWKMPVDRLYS